VEDETARGVLQAISEKSAQLAGKNSRKVRQRGGEDPYLAGVAKRVREAREHAGLTQADMSVQLGITTNVLGNWEQRGCREAKQMAEIGRVTGLNPAWIAFGDPHPRDSVGVQPAPDMTGEGWLGRDPSAFPLFTKLMASKLPRAES
jgi:DNA-binding transcriptional regulator YiaG